MEKQRVIQEGDLSEFLADPPKAEDLQWALSKSSDKINSVIVPLGYTQEQVKSPEFQKLYGEIVERFYQDYPEKLYNLALYTGREPDLKISTDDELHLKAETQQLYELANALAKLSGENVDCVHFMIKPDAFENFHKESFFAYANDIRSVIAGPYQNTQNKWVLDSTSTLSHEMAHSLSRRLVSQYDPMHFADYYTRKDLNDFPYTPKGFSEIQLLKMNCLSEYFLEEPEKPGRIMPSASFCINEAMRQYEEKRGEIPWHDTGITFMNIETNVLHSVLCPGNGKNLMDTACLRGERYESPGASDFQKELFDVCARVFLAHTGRINEPELLQAHAEFKKAQQSQTFSKVTRSSELAQVSEVDTWHVMMDEVKDGLPPVYDYSNKMTKRYRG